MLSSPPLLKERIKFSARLAGNPGPFPGSMRPAKQASGIRRKKVTGRSGSQGVRVQTWSQRGRGERDGGARQPRARPAAASGEPAGERGRRRGPRSPWSRGRSSTYITLQLFLRGGLAKPSRADHFAAAHGACLSGSGPGSRGTGGPAVDAADARRRKGGEDLALPRRAPVRQGGLAPRRARAPRPSLSSAGRWT